MDETDFNIKVGAYLKELRKKNNYSAKKLSKLINRSEDTIYSYEEGSRSIPLQVLFELSNIYGVSIDDILKSNVTTNRPKAISLDLIEEDKKTKIILDSERDNLIFYKSGEWELRYYIKCVDIRFNKEMLALINNAYTPVIIGYDEEKIIYSVYDINKKTTALYKPFAFKKSVIIVGDYAGTINQEMKIGSIL